MAMDYERALLSKVIRDQTFHLLGPEGIDRNFFLDEEHLEKYDLLLEHFAEHGASMGVDAFKSNYPTYKILPADEPLSWYVEQLHNRHKYDLMSGIVSEAADALHDDDIQDALRILLSGASDLSAAVGKLTDTDITQHGLERIEMYAAWAESPDALRGISFGFDSVDYTSRGAQPGNFIVFAGPAGAGKTTMLLKSALHMHEMMAKILFISFEMPYEEIAARYDAMRSGVSHHRLLRGLMRAKDQKRLRSKAIRDQDNESFILSEDIDSTTTVSGIRAKIQEHKPDVVIVDGMYMMIDEEGEPSGSSQALTNISRGFKRLALGELVPVIGSTQALESKMSKGRMSLNSIGYTSAFQQDASVVLGVSKEVDRNGIVIPGSILLQTLKSRNGPPVSSKILVDWDEMTFEEDRSEWGGGNDSSAAEVEQGAKVDF